MPWLWFGTAKRTHNSWTRHFSSPDRHTNFREANSSQLCRMSQDIETSINHQQQWIGRGTRLRDVKKQAAEL